MPTIDDLKAIQRRLCLGHVHVVYIGSDGFVIAHTNEERASGMRLEDCELHEWLAFECQGAPEPIGYYTVTAHQVDVYSEPYPVAQFDFELLSI